jgi:hypothetical protein
MLYHPYHTEGIHDTSLPNGHFRVDAHNSFFFRSPMDNWAGSWTVPHAFNELIFQTSRLSHADGRYNFYIPSVECDIALLIMRNVLDGQGNWKQKHINTINELVEEVVDEDYLANVLKIASIAKPHEVIAALRCHDFREINKLVLGE